MSSSFKRMKETTNHLDQNQIQRYLELAIEAAIAAGKAIMEVYATAFEVVLKPDQSPITKADEQANALIAKYLLKTPFPVISEESTQQDYAVRQHWQSCWIVDPLDGTKEFVKRNGEFTVNIALVTNGSPVLGVIYAPVSQTLYFAAQPSIRASKLNVEDGHTTAELIERAERLYPQHQTEQLFRVACSRSHLNSRTEELIAQLKEAKEVALLRVGSALKFCLLAEGKADLYPRFAPTMEWDTAAGQAICESVGLKVLDAESRQPLQYNKANLFNPFFIVTH